jgi:hypothetical protein
MLLDTFKFECLESGKGSSIPGSMIFVEHLKALIPGVKNVRKKVGTQLKTYYRGLCIDPIDTCSVSDLRCTTTCITKCLPDNYYIKKISPEEIICETQSGYLSNGNGVTKSITLHMNGMWELEIAGKKVNLSKAYIDGTFHASEKGIKVVFSIVDKIQLCCGLEITKSIIVSRYHTLDLWKRPDNTAVRSMRSVMCEKVISLNSHTFVCRTCQKMTFSQSDNKENQPEPHAPGPESLIKQVRNLFPGADENMIELLVEQAKNVGRHPKGRRWSKKFIGVCMQMYNRSPHCYGLLYSSKLLVLPSQSLLILYKNAIKQKPGFEDDVFQWMYAEANRQNIPEGERYGGVIFDEMAIQTDIQIDKYGDVVEISGFTDYGKEGDTCHALKQGSKEKS